VNLSRYRKPPNVESYRFDVRRGHRQSYGAPAVPNFPHNRENNRNLKFEAPALFAVRKIHHIPDNNNRKYYTAAPCFVNFKLFLPWGANDQAVIVAAVLTRPAALANGASGVTHQLVPLHRGFDGLAERHCWIPPTSGSVWGSLLWMERVMYRSGCAHGRSAIARSFVRSHICAGVLSCRRCQYRDQVIIDDPKGRFRTTRFSSAKQ
jgi:hypothetical protein